MSESPPRQKSFWNHRPTRGEAIVIVILLAILGLIIAAVSWWTFAWTRSHSPLIPAIDASDG